MEENEGINTDSGMQTDLELTSIQTQLVRDSGPEVVTIEDCLKQKYVSPLEGEGACEGAMGEREDAEECHVWLWS